MDWFIRIIDKITHQSTLIVMTLFIYSFFALQGQTNYFSPIAITGYVAFVVSVFLTIENFISNQISENYKYIIEELKGLISQLKSQHKFSENSYQKMITNTQVGNQNVLDRMGYTSDTGAQTIPTETA